MIADAGRLQVGDLVAQGQRDLVGRCRRGGWSSRTKDQASIVTGPVSMPLTGRSVSDWAYVVQRTVIGSGRETSPYRIGGRT